MYPGRTAQITVVDSICVYLWHLCLVPLASPSWCALSSS